MTRAASGLHVPTLGAVVLIVSVAAGACQQEEDTSRRQPLGGQPATGMQGQLPEGHPEVPGMEDAAARAAAERDLPPSVTVPLDSGNVAYRAGDYEEARRHFRAAVEADTTAAAGWFGVYMAERALGNERAADSALRRAGGLDGASGMHPAPDGEAGGGEMPHPPMEVTTDPPDS